MGKQWKQWETSFSGLQNHWMVTAAMKLKDTCSLEEKLWETYMQVRKQQLELDMEQQIGSK